MISVYFVSDMNHVAVEGGWMQKNHRAYIHDYSVYCTVRCKASRIPVTAPRLEEKPLSH